MKYKWALKTAAVLGIVGGLTWVTIGLFNWNVVEWLLGLGTMTGRVIYVVAGFSGVLAGGILLSK